LRLVVELAPRRMAAKESWRPDELFSASSRLYLDERVGPIVPDPDLARHCTLVQRSRFERLELRPFQATGLDLGEFGFVRSEITSPCAALSPRPADSGESKVRNRGLR
jgi:hypothetical protein